MRLLNLLYLCTTIVISWISNWGRDKMAAILQTTLLIHWNLYQVYNQQWVSVASDNGTVSNRRQAIIGTDDGLFYWRIYASLGQNEIYQIQTFPIFVGKRYLVNCLFISKDVYYNAATSHFANNAHTTKRDKRPYYTHVYIKLLFAAWKTSMTCLTRKIIGCVSKMMAR